MGSNLTINTNQASQNAQRRLASTTKSLQQTYERLSSGLRINRASDDAAGLAIASSLNIDTRVYTQGVRNTNDALSYYSIAEGSLSSLVNITIRLKELAQQSSNGVLSSTQRKSLDAEAQALGKEYRRIVQSTSFNGQNIVNSGNGPLSVQVGYSELSLSGGESAAGNFKAPENYTTGGWSAVGSDLNGDEIMDLAVATSASRIDVFIGNGDGTFQNRVTYTTSGTFSIAVTAADLNGDGIADLISADNSGNDVSIFIGNGNGTFKASVGYTTDLTPRWVATDDLNGDNIVDVITANQAGTVSVLIGNGNGTFRAHQDYTSAAISRSVVVSDVNGDGISDLVSADYGASQLSVLIGNGNGSFKARQVVGTGPGPNSVWAHDFNGDGFVDLVTAERINGQLCVYMGNGNGTFSAGRTLQIAAGATPGVGVADYNGDDIVDLIAPGTIFYGNGDGTFRTGLSFSTGSGPISLFASDVNSDGINDLVTANQSAGSISILLGNGVSQAVAAPIIGIYSLRNQDSSLYALTHFDRVLDRLTTALGNLGANESRLRAVTSVMSQSRINLESAASQILDVDVAEESAKLTTGNILQQAGAAILSQANQQPALALRLLSEVPEL